MSVNVVPHLNFRSDARAALGFYRTVFDGDLAIITYGDMGNVQEPAEADQVVWGQVADTSGPRVMAYDVPSGQPWDQGQDPFFISLRGDAAEEVTAYWEKLAVGSTVIVPLEPSQWAPLYGMLRDPFGVTWVVDVVAQYSPS